MPQGRTGPEAILSTQPDIGHLAYILSEGGSVCVELGQAHQQFQASADGQQVGPHGAVFRFPIGARLQSIRKRPDRREWLTWPRRQDGQHLLRQCDYIIHAHCTGTDIHMPSPATDLSAGYSGLLQRAGCGLVWSDAKLAWNAARICLKPALSQMLQASMRHGATRAIATRDEKHSDERIGHVGMANDDGPTIVCLTSRRGRLSVNRNPDDLVNWA